MKTAIVFFVCGGGSSSRENNFLRKTAVSKKHNALRWKSSQRLRNFSAVQSRRQKTTFTAAFSKNKIFSQYSIWTAEFFLAIYERALSADFQLAQNRFAPHSACINSEDGASQLNSIAQNLHKLQIWLHFYSCEGSPPPTLTARLLIFFTKNSTFRLFIKKHDVLRRKNLPRRENFSASQNRRPKSTFTAAFSKNKSFSQYSIWTGDLQTKCSHPAKFCRTSVIVLLERLLQH